MLLVAWLEAFLHCQGIQLLRVLEVLGHLCNLPSKKVLGAGVELLHLLPGTLLLLYSLEIDAPEIRHEGEEEKPILPPRAQREIVQGGRELDQVREILGPINHQVFLELHHDLSCLLPRILNGDGAIAVLLGSLTENPPLI